MFRIKPIWNAKPPKKGGYLLVANHSNRHDPFMIGGLLTTPINYMANLDGVTGGKKFFSSGIGCFNIKKGRADRQAFTKAIQLLKEGYGVGIFPEGDRSWLGETVQFSSAIPSLAKKLNTPVLMARMTGNYLSTPRWSEKARRGKMFMEFDVITREQIADMTKDEVYKRISEYIYNDDFTNERLKGVEFTGKNVAEGIENLIWNCPSCKTPDHIIGKGDVIECSNCSTKYDIDANQRVSDNNQILKNANISNTKEWFKWQESELKESITDNPIIFKDTDVELIEEPSENKWASLGKGDIELTTKGIVWKSNSSDKMLEFKKEDILNIVDNFNQYAFINLPQSRLRIVFNHTCSLKWTTALKYI